MARVAAMGENPLAAVRAVKQLFTVNATETDLARLASAASNEALRFVHAVQRTGGRSTSLFLLLSTGGVFVYLLYRRKSSGDTPSPRGPKGRPRPPKWISKGWLWWMIYGDSFDALLEKIKRETANAEAGGTGRIIAKVNSLNEPQLIDALYDGSTEISTVTD